MLYRFEKLVFLALIFSIPFQKRSFLFGPDPIENFFEWSSGFLYVTDFLVMILGMFLVLSFLRKQESRTFFRKSFQFRIFVSTGVMAYIFLLLLLAFAFISLTQADLVTVGVYRFLKLVEFVFLFFYATAKIRAIGIMPALWAFIASGVFQSILAILQFGKQSSLGLEIFHESTLIVGMKGVAQISAYGLDMIRAYGTFPSPNALAGFLGICLFFVFYLFVRENEAKAEFERTQTNNPAPIFPLSPQKIWPLKYLYTALATCVGRIAPSLAGRSIAREIGGGVTLERILMGAAIFMLSFGLLLTFSRGTIIFFTFVTGLFFAGLFILKRFEQYKKSAFQLGLLVIGSWLLVVASAWPEVSSRFLGSSVGEPAIQERLFFNEVGVGTVRQDPLRLLFGVGMGNFVHTFMQSMPGLPSYLYQPVHNIFILVAAETGTLGLLTFALFVALLLGKMVKRFFTLVHIPNDRALCVQAYILLLVMGFMMLIAMYDHYFWTLQQGSLMFWITLGLLASKVQSMQRIPVPSRKSSITA